ncbi:MAG: metallophosphoesterase [Phyllobacterium sp.]
MKSTGFAAMLVLAFGLAPAAAPIPAEAQAVLKNIPENAGRRCNTPPKGSGVIVGIYRGLDKSSGMFGDGRQEVNRYRCFESVAQCQGWLYTMQSNYFTELPAAIGCWRR